jgi:CelD/BcsL family acetyltransferase involved in cellulose biosynthesis
MVTKYTNLPANEIDQSLMSTWSKIQRLNRSFASPFLSPHFTLAVADIRDDVFVTVIENDGSLVGFFPYQVKGHRAHPVGGFLNDCQAVIATADAHWEPRELLVASGLSLWDFDHLVANQTEFTTNARATSTSPIIRLDGGFECYIADRKAAGSKSVAQLQRKLRKLSRENGEVRFCPNSKDKSVLECVFRWKLEQCRRTGSYPFFEESWTVELVERLHETEGYDFFGALSVLWVGDEIAAAHFGIASDRQWHWWFPTYSDNWQRYSPGGLMLLCLCEHVGSETTSQTVIDLGKGDDPYKSSFANDSYGLLEGHVANGSAFAVFRSAKRRARTWLSRTPALAPICEIRRWMRGN